MCGIVGAASLRNVTPILLEGLKRLEYRGYDSAGLALLSEGQIQRERELGKVAALESLLEQRVLKGNLGIAHTRWATHGKPSKLNAHPHLSSASVAVVHNGIIENHEPLRRELQEKGYRFHSETDTEVVAHLFDYCYQLASGQTPPGRLLRAFRQTLKRLRGAYALGILHIDHPDILLCARMGSPLVVGCGSDEQFIASDPLALLQVTDRFIYLEEGDYGLLTRTSIDLYSLATEVVDPKADQARDAVPMATAAQPAGSVPGGHRAVQRPVIRYEHGDQVAEKGDYRHFMLKEIHEQPQALKATLEGKVSDEGQLLTSILGPDAETLLAQTQHVQIVSCGTSYHAGLVTRYWIESIAGLPCSVEVASEFRYRHVVVPENTLFLAISQSGETADTLAALRFARNAGYLATLAICNVPGSSLVRESDLRLMTNAGPEIGVASTKAFTTQLAALLWLTAVLGTPRLGGERVAALIAELQALPAKVEQVLELEPAIAELSARFANKHHTLFLGRGPHYPVAMEGALKLKEISYIHAEAYAAGELKHGPLALVDDDMPVVTVAPSDDLLEKLKSNLQEVRARGGQLINFVCEQAGLEGGEGITNLVLPKVSDITAPILFSVPLQLLSYHVALVKGTDVDKPRNLAKSVTVE